jgi:cysteine-rich repeat protein
MARACTSGGGRLAAVSGDRVAPGRGSGDTKRMPRWSALALVVPSLVVARAEGRPAPAAGPSVAGASAVGVAARAPRILDGNAPPARAAAWKAFTARRGAWQVSWDVATATPARIWGEGIAAPGANRDPAIAQAASRAILDDELALLAPGTKPEHWRLAADVVHGPDGELRTVRFAHHVDGVPVRGSAISIVWKRDRAIVLGSSAQSIAAAPGPARIDPATAAAAAVRWASASGAARPTVRGDHGLAIVATDGGPRLARLIEVDRAAPRGRWLVSIDADTGAPIGAEDRLWFGTGTLRYDAPIRYPAGGRQAFPAAGVTLDVGGATTTDDAGRFTFPGVGPLGFATSLAGPRVAVTNAAGARAATTLSITDGGVATWSPGAAEAVDAQVSGFVHASRAKDFARSLDPGLAWLGAVLEVVVNEPGSCNAYSDGDAIHFLTAGAGCENTARVADLVAHEFAHSLHVQATLTGEDAIDVPLSEGLADYFAATLVDDPGVGRGAMLGSGAPVRDLDPPGLERQWPRDIDTDPKVTGLILAGALWDLRRELISRLGPTAGRLQADRLFYAVLRRASDLPTAYPELLAADDDDGNLANGTPNRCAIDLAFAPHGLVDASATFGVRPPVRRGFQVDLEVNPIAGCAAPMVTGATVFWSVDDGAPTALAMGATSDGFTATLPTADAGAEVAYRIEVTLAGGASLRFPDNPGDPSYRFYVGDLRAVACTDFEADPFAAGWTHAATAGNDDWDWGPPAGTLGNGDPLTAASGANIVGTDLRGDGVYQRSSVERLTSPTFDVRGYSQVRLRFKRWLAIEDGFYDTAAIAADGAVIWRNFASPGPDGQVHTLDREWREIDLDLGPAAADGAVTVEFRLATDEGVHFGGWNLDDVCLYVAGDGPPVCGNNAVEAGESCDDGNTTAGDGCSERCALEDPPPEDGGCCSTGADPRGPIALALAAAAALITRRRKPRA